MENNHNNSLDFDNRQAKDIKIKAQFDEVFEALKIRPMTMKELSVYTGIMRSNICWYIRTLRNTNRISVTKIRRCSITGYPRVQELTTDQSLFAESNQLKMF